MTGHPADGGTDAAADARRREPWREEETLGRRLLIALALVALVPRLLNLGSFSMWLDEVIETQQASGSLARTWAELRSDVVHPPLEGLLTWTLVHLELEENARRLAPIAFGVATVLLLASWTARRFGRNAGLACGLFAALAPLHVHYSQELRPYSLALLFVALSVVLADRLLDRITPLRFLLVGLAVLGCLYSLYFATLVLVPVGWLVLDTAVTGEPEAARRARRLLAWSPLFLLGVGLAYLPWISTLLAVRHQRMQRQANDWTLQSAAERWQALTVGSGVSWGGWSAWGGAVALALVLLGAAWAVRSPAGRTALAGALAGTVGVDLLLLQADHWSSDRYNLVGWLFLPVLAGIGAAVLLRLRAGRAVAAVALGLLALAQARGILHDYHSREDWRRVAEAVHAVWQPGEPVFALNQSTRICLLYYLREIRSDAASAVVSVDGSHRRLARLWPADRCALLVLRNRGRTGNVVRLTRDFPLLAHYPATGARIRLLTPAVRDRLSRRLSLGAAAPAAVDLPCDRWVPQELLASRAERPFAPLLRLLGLVGKP